MPIAHPRGRALPAGAGASWVHQDLSQPLTVPFRLHKDPFGFTLRRVIENKLIHIRN